MINQLAQNLSKLISNHANVLNNAPRSHLNLLALDHNEAWQAPCGALVTWHRPDSTGRSPQDTVIVNRPESSPYIDWSSEYNLPITPATFDLLFADATERLKSKPQIYKTDRCVGADPEWALPIITITDKALYSAFTMNMFRQKSVANGSSIFSQKPFYLIVLPDDKLVPKNYHGRLRIDPTTDQTSSMVVAMDLDRRMGIIIGSAYLGSVKKLIFTIYNYYLPHESILPLHCSANQGTQGNTALLLGLSGTGKTTMSADPHRKLIGDDEHGWSDNGIANFENGCYAKLVDLDQQKEPDIYQATFHQDKVQYQNTIIENAMMYPDGTFDLSDKRLTPNSRASYPLHSLENIKADPQGDHPDTILFLTADANGVLPPVAHLNHNQAMLWFMLGYTSKIPGTETDIKQPQTTFSRFFGAPFMPCNPSQYTSLLGEKLKKHNTDVYLINTGWVNGPYGIGHRIDIDITRKLVNAALAGKLKNMVYQKDPIFKFHIPQHCPDINDDKLLFPKQNWPSKEEYKKRAQSLAEEFATHFRQSYGDSNISKNIWRACPGKIG